MGKHNRTKEDDKYKNVKTAKNSKKGNKKKKKHIVLIIFLILLVALGIFIAKRLYDAQGNVLGAILGHDEHTRENLDTIQILILGESTGMSDTIVVAQYNPKNQTAALLSIPRDTFVGTSLSNARSSDKINSKFSHGETIEDTVEAVNTLTGLNIHYYILVDTEALIKLVDTIGGLEFDVPIDMNYDDATQDLHIHLSAGYQKLNGAQVEQLVRFRHNNDGSTYSYSTYGGEDFGRMRTQRNVIISLAQQTLKFKNITEIFNIIDILKTYVKTNINLDDIKDYVPYAVEMNMDEIKTGQLPGADGPSNGIYFFIPDKEATLELVDELFNGITPESEEQQESDGENTTNENVTDDT